MKTSELQPPELDYHVARAEGWEEYEPPDDPFINNAKHEHAFKYIRKDHLQATIPADWVRQVTRFYYSPSTDWSQGGPIIEREKIDIEWWELEKVFAGWWQDDFKEPMLGPTPLIAAMRAYVASKFGEEVEEV